MILTANHAGGKRRTPEVPSKPEDERRANLFFLAFRSRSLTCSRSHVSARQSPARLATIRGSKHNDCLQNNSSDRRMALRVDDGFLFKTEARIPYGLYTRIGLLATRCRIGTASKLTIPNGARRLGTAQFAASSLRSGSDTDLKKQYLKIRSILCINVCVCVCVYRYIRAKLAVVCVF